MVDLIAGIHVTTPVRDVSRSSGREEAQKSEAAVGSSEIADAVSISDEAVELHIAQLASETRTILQERQGEALAGSAGAGVEGLL